MPHIPHWLCRIPREAKASGVCWFQSSSRSMQLPLGCKMIRGWDRGVGMHQQILALPTAEQQAHMRVFLLQLNHPGARKVTFSAFVWRCQSYKAVCETMSAYVWPMKYALVSCGDLHRFELASLKLGHSQCKDINLTSGSKTLALSGHTLCGTVASVTPYPKPFLSCVFAHTLHLYICRWKSC